MPQTSASGQKKLGCWHSASIPLPREGVQNPLGHLRQGNQCLRRPTVLIRFRLARQWEGRPDSLQKRSLHNYRTGRSRTNSASRSAKLWHGSAILDPAWAFEEMVCPISHGSRFPGQVRIDPEAPTGFLSLLPFRRTFEVRPFQMAKFPVTNAQFQAFFSATDGYHFWTWWKDINKSRDAPCFPGKEQANEPRVNVTWYDAIAFCRWFSAKTGTTIRLPTEWEWRQAATGGDPTRDYPWGSEWDSSRCSSRESMATAVGMYPAGSSLQGLHDITGNVWEWGLNRPETTPSRPDTVQVERYGTRAILGGFWNSQPQDLKTFIRSYTASDDHTSYLGFRLVQEH